jgi:hypothetical protein
VSGNDDDEALTWAGGRDPSHYETPEAKPQKVGRPAKSAKRGSAGDDADEADDSGDDDSDSDADDDDLAPATSSVVLVSLGILGGIYLLYTVGWFVSWQRFAYSSTDSLELAAFHIQQVLAIVAAPLWFALAVVLTRGRRPIIRLLWLLAGALVLVPWSFVFGS